MVAHTVPELSKVRQENQVEDQLGRTYHSYLPFNNNSNGKFVKFFEKEQNCVY